MDKLEELKQAEKKLTEVNRQLYDKSQVIISYDSKIKSFDPLIKEKEAELDDLMFEIQKHKEIYQKLEHGLASINEVIISKNKEANKISTEIADFKEKHLNLVQESSAHIKKLTAQMSNLNAQIEQLNNDSAIEIKKNKDAVDSLISKANKIKSEIKESEEYANTVRESIGGLLIERDGINKEIAEAVIERDRIASELKELDDEKADFEKKQKTWQQIRDSEYADIQTKKSEAEAILKQAMGAKQSVDDALAEAESKRQQTVALKSEIEQLEKEVKYKELKVAKLIKDYKLDEEIKKLSS
jgi:chromosome segregation ATPase